MKDQEQIVAKNQTEDSSEKEIGHWTDEEGESERVDLSDTMPELKAEIEKITNDHEAYKTFHWKSLLK